MDLTTQLGSEPSQQSDFDFLDSQLESSRQLPPLYTWFHAEKSIGSDGLANAIGLDFSNLAEENAVSLSGNASKIVFPFFHLPSEIRLIIYRMAFCRDEPILFRTHRKVPELDHDNFSSDDGLSHDLFASRTGLGRHRRQGRSGRKKLRVSPPDARPCEDPLTPQLLLVCKKMYQEARSVLYSENTFVLELDSAARTLTSLSQPSRSSIKHINLSVPTHHDIIEGFADLVRLHLRYCWGLKKLTLTLPHFFPQDRYAASSGTNVYANSFHILRWLPQGTEVVLDGGATDEIRSVIAENTKIGRSLDKVGDQLSDFY
jgi:hypothetical protein